jgi:hypothetical protein
MMHEDHELSQVFAGVAGRINAKHLNGGYGAILRE